MPKKSLQSWYNSNEITYSQKEIIKKFGVGDYYPECERRDFLKVYYWNDILERNITKLENGCSFPNYLVYQMNFFSAWWNNNLMLFIDGEENNYQVKLIVYEMPYRKNGEIKMREIFEVFFVGWICPGDLSEARRKAKNIEDKLRSDNPILCGTPVAKIKFYYYDDYSSSVFPFLFSNDEVKRTEVDFNKARYSPDDYFKPLDIAMICREGMVHSCIYLGNNKICHALSGNQVRIENWNDFFILTGANKMLRYHPVIAFKKTNEIIEHIANCVEGQETYYSPRKKRDFNIYDNNCENFTNRCVLGINFSQLTERKNEEKYGTPRMKELNVEEHLNNTKRDLDGVGRNLSWSQVNDRNSRINEIKEYRRSSGYENFDVMRDGVNMYEACIEVQPKSGRIFKEMYENYYKKCCK